MAVSLEATAAADIADSSLSGHLAAAFFVPDAHAIHSPFSLSPLPQKDFLPPPNSRASERDRDEAEYEGKLPPLPPLSPSASWLRVVRSAVRGAVWLGGGRPKTLYFDGEIEALANNATLQAQERVEVCLEALSAPHLPAAAGGCACVCVCSIYLYIYIDIYIYIYMYIYDSYIYAALAEVESGAAAEAAAVQALFRLLPIPRDTHTLTHSLMAPSRALQQAQHAAPQLSAVYAAACARAAAAAAAASEAGTSAAARTGGGNVGGLSGSRVRGEDVSGAAKLRYFTTRY